MTMSTKDHADAAVRTIEFVKALKLSPPDQIMVLSTAADMLENEIASAATALVLQQALNPDK